jgi:protein-disulfide isomerase
VGDKDVTFGELGEDAQKAEREALFTYCRDTQRVRQAAVDRAVDDAVLSEAATAKNTDIEGYLRTEVMEKVPDPSDKEIAAYYDANKSDDAPPLDQVMARVVQVMKDERAKEAYGAHLEKLRKKASVQVALPDVRPPAQPIEIPEHTATFGPADAAVTIVEFSDFECPYCSRAVPAVDELKKRYGDKVRFAFRHFPLSFHPRARPAAKVAHCAGAQDKFWPVHDGIFATQRDLSDAALRGVAAKAGVDPGKLDACLNAPETDAAIEADIEAARAAGVEGTPSFYVNGRPYDGPISGEGFARAIEQELAAG